MRERINKCQIQQGAAAEFVGSLPTKAPTFSGDALGDVLMCSCKQNRPAVLIRLYDIIIIVQAHRRSLFRHSTALHQSKFYSHQREMGTVSLTCECRLCALCGAHVTGVLFLGVKWGIAIPRIHDGTWCPWESGLKPECMNYGNMEKVTRQEYVTRQQQAVWPGILRQRFEPVLYPTAGSLRRTCLNI